MWCIIYIYVYCKGDGVMHLQGWEMCLETHTDFKPQKK